MSAKDVNTLGTMRYIKINRFLSFALALNLLIYSLFVITGYKPYIAVPVGLSWAVLIGYALITEIILKIVNNSALYSEKNSSKFFNLNIIVTSLFLIMTTFILGSKEYLFLCVIPIFQAVLEEKPHFSGMILGAGTAFVISAEISNWFNFYYLPLNQLPVTSRLLGFLTVLGILSSLGFMLAKTITFTRGKADYLHNIATTDALTGLLNRREFNVRLSGEFSRAKRHKSPLSLALFDIDFFKKINDTYGHNAGDAILKELGDLIATNTRACDVAARYGGEEFALILPETPQSKAFELMDRLRTLVEEETFNKTGQPVKATISVGVAQLDLTDTSPLDFCERTDKALYLAKENGRNRVERAPFGVPKVTVSFSAGKKAAI